MFICKILFILIFSKKSMISYSCNSFFFTKNKVENLNFPVKNKNNSRDIYSKKIEDFQLVQFNFYGDLIHMNLN